MKPILVIALLWAAGSSAHAQPRAAMLQTSSTADANDVAPAFDRLARSRLEELAPMSIDAAPPLSLEDLQLAVGCVGESAECLSAVAQRLGVDVMVVPSVEVSADVLVGSFLRLDESDGRVRRVTRQVTTESELLDVVEPMLRELFELPSIDNGAEHGSRPNGRARSVTTADPPEASPTDRPFPVGPSVMAGLGAATILGGVITGVLAKDAENAYAETETDTASGVDRAYGQLDAAQRNALIANILLGVGAAAIVGAAVWWLLGESSPFGVAASSDGLAVSFEGHWGGDS